MINEYINYFYCFFFIYTIMSNTIYIRIQTIYQKGKYYGVLLTYLRTNKNLIGKK